MLKAKIYTDRQYYINKFGEKEYLDNSEADSVYFIAAFLTKQKIQTEFRLLYEVYGDTEEVVKRSIELYRSDNPKEIVSKIDIENID